jgi:dephospho-CoA kinase
VIIVGLTGSIAMGKSTTGRMFAAEGVAVFDSDAAVHAIYSGLEAATIEAAFPGVLQHGAVDRELLARQVVGDNAALARLESLVHPMVSKARREFVHAAAARGARLVVVDIPLLFETGGERSVDIVAVVSASQIVQKARALARQGMTSERFERIVARQTPDAEKRRRAHIVIDTNGAVAEAHVQVRSFLRSTATMFGGRAKLDA